MKHISVLVCVRPCSWYWLVWLSIRPGQFRSRKPAASRFPVLRFFFAFQEIVVGRVRVAWF
jgi:hypothetical protein